MRLALTVFIVLVAFAANSVLTRAGLAADEIGPGAFLAIRTLSGALVLIALVLLTTGARHLPLATSWAAAVALLAYMVGFSYAYVSMDTGTGALILFGGVQLTMFAGAVLSGERPGWARWIGSGLGLGGLAILFAPGAAAPAVVPGVFMGIAALGWGTFSLIGRGGGPALPRTAAAFALAALPACALGVAMPGGAALSQTGLWLAIASGALASGCGYALWYAVLPRLDASVAALAQLTVPLIALVGGMVFLGEAASWRFGLASVFVLGGVALGVLSPLRRR